MLLTIKNLNVHFHNDSAVVKAVENLNMQISCGEIIGLIGESGSGKSTIALSILNLLPSAGKIVSGEVLFSGKNLSIMPETELRKIRGKDIAMIFQDPAAYLNPVIRVGKQIAEPLIIHTGWPLKKALIKAQTLLSDLGVSDASSRIRNYPFELSGGQKQRVMIAMAVINQPQLLIADEPTTALDVSIQSQLIQLLLKLRNQLNMSILMISHDLPLISQIADHINIMYCGKIVESAPTTALLSHPLHPYTQGLLFSLSSSSAKWERIPVIEGNICDPSHKPSGCYFHPRCPKATSLCRNEYPALLEYENRHVTSCHHVSD